MIIQAGKYNIFYFLYDLTLSFAKTTTLWYLLYMKEENKTLPHYLEHLQSQGQYWFVRENTIKALNLSEIAFQKATHRLILKGKVNRVKGGFYTIVPPEYQATGSLPASWFIDDLMKYYKQKYYVGLLTGSALHGAAHQQPMAFQVITNKLTRPIILGQVRIEFLYKKTIEPHFYQSIKTPSGTMNLSTPEITALDLIRYMNAAGQINQVATVLSELIEKINPEKLSDLLVHNKIEITAAQRLGYICENLSLKINLTALKKELKKRKLSYRFLVVGGNPNTIIRDKNWHILVNEKLEPDEL